MEKIPLLFPITVFQTLDTYGTITKARARIFYKYKNRNGSYITDDFADKLLSTLPGSPVKGVYDETIGDYTDHGETRSQGKAYGFVPETNHNIAYEDHLDDDGVMRTYACADVYLWTSLYDEAIDILGSAQSMELYEPSVEGEWKIIEGQRLFEYYEGSFLGLQVLGKDVEPCFEGAAFFSLLQDFPQDFLQVLYDSYLQFQLQQGGNENMEVTFKLSDAQKENKIFLALNEHDYRYYVHAVYDEYAIVFDFETEAFFRVDYTKNDDTDEVSLTSELEAVFVEYLTQVEKDSLATLRAMQSSFEAALEDFEQISEDLEEQARKNEESAMTISTLLQEKEKTEVTITELEEELEQLSTYKKEIETAGKQAIIDKYSEYLPTDTLETYESRFDELTETELEKELAFELVTANPSVFSYAPQGLPKDTGPETGLAAVLGKYKNN